ncbi:hypothetical protein [Archaeoglobus sp.]
MVEGAIGCKSLKNGLKLARSFSNFGLTSITLLFAITATINVLKL